MSQHERSDYKQVWNELAGTLEGAKLSILGVSAEADFTRTAAMTLRDFRETVGIHPDDTILEIGCGIGRVGSALAPICREWIGCDVSPNMLAFAQERLASERNVRLVELSGIDLTPIESASVDLVYCHVVFMHLWPYDRYSYVLEAMRVLKPGGRIFIDNIDILTDEGWGLFEQHRAMSQRPPHMSLPSTPDELITYLSRAGFTNIQTRNVRFWVQAWATVPQPNSSTFQSHRLMGS